MEKEDVVLILRQGVINTDTRSIASDAAVAWQWKQSFGSFCFVDNDDEDGIGWICAPCFKLPGYTALSGHKDWTTFRAVHIRKQIQNSSEEG